MTWQGLADLTGDAGWAPAAMREHFRQVEAWRGADAQPLPGDSEEDRDRLAGHGRDGWLGTTRAAPTLAGREPKFLDVINAIEETSRDRFGIPEEISLPRDVNAADTPDDFEGMSFIPVAVRDGHRNGSRERLTTIAAEHPDRLQIRLNSLVSRVVFEGTRAVGVEYAAGERLYAAAHDGGEPGATTGAAESRVVRARHEVILAAGAFNTPQLLMLSGIGPRDELDAFGIDVLKDAPGVGANLHDRYEVSVVSEMVEDYPIFAGQALDVPHDDGTPDDLFTEWRDHATGPYSTNGSLAALVARSSAVAAGDPFDLIIFALPIEFRGYYPGYAKDAVTHHNRLSVLVLKGTTQPTATPSWKA